MRRVVGKRARCILHRLSPCEIAARLPHAAALERGARIGAVDEAQHAVAPGRIEHGDQEAPRHVAIGGAEPGKRAADARGLQAGEPQRQRLALAAVTNSSRWRRSLAPSFCST